MKTLDSNSIDRLTFEDIRLMKEDTRKELDTRKAALLAKGKQVFSPPSFFPGASLLGNLKMGYTLFTGAMVGYKLIRSVKRFFRR